LRHRTATFITIAALLAGVTACSDDGDTTPTPTATATSTQTSSVGASPRDTTYIIEGREVTLVDGFAEVEAAPGSASKVTTRYFGNEATADLDGDGLDDVGVVLTQESGGSGTFFYAVVALQTADGYVGTNGILLGDRIALQSTEIRDGVLIVNYADRAAGEPFTTPPSVGTSRSLKVVDGALTEAPPED
jgi:hypothetical protein